MKPFAIYRLPALLLCLGGALVLAPSSRAQSDVAPDHFDGTDSWAAAAAAKVPTKKAQPQPASTPSARSNQPAAPSLQPVAAREVTAPRRSATKKRKPTTSTTSN